MVLRVKEGRKGDGEDMPKVGRYKKGDERT